MNRFATFVLPMIFCSTVYGSVIDVHSHYIGDEYVSYLSEHNLSMSEGFPLPSWQAEDTIKFMQDADITTSVLTLAPIHPYVDRSSRTFIRKLNENMAALKNRSGGKFLFCATLPLTNVEDAIKEAVYALDVLKADGISLGSNIAGQYLGDSELEPLMQVLNERSAVVIVHPHKPYGLADSLFRTTPLAMFEYPADTTRAVVNLIMHNTPVRYSRVRMVIPHAGSFLALTIPRMKAVYPVVKARNLVPDIDIDASVSRLYFDIAGVQSAEVIKSMLSFAHPSKILYGSDFPYFREDVLLDTLNNLKKQMAEDRDLKPYVEAIFSENARQLFSH